MELYRRYLNIPNKAENETVNMPDKHGSYGALLFDKRWKEKRANILTRDGNQCVICEGSAALEVHHRQYQYVKVLKKFKAPWEYDDASLITLCNTCHQRGHSKFKVPIIYI